MMQVPHFTGKHRVREGGLRKWARPIFPLFFLYPSKEHVASRCWVCQGGVYQGERGGCVRGGCG